MLPGLDGPSLVPSSCPLMRKRV